MNINILRYFLFGIAGGQEVERKLFLNLYNCVLSFGLCFFINNASGIFVFY